MALVELEMTEFTFHKFLLLMLSAAPIPVPTLDGLPADQLVTSLEWGEVTLGAIPAGGHLLPAKVSVKINHVSIAELEAHPGTPGHTTEATAWLQIGITGAVLSAGLERIDVAGAAPQMFHVRLELWNIELDVDESVKILIGTVLYANEIVTLRLSTNGLDNLTLPPANRLEGWGNHLLVRVSGEAFADLLRDQLADALDPPPQGSRIEEAPHAVWGNWAPPVGQDAWAAVANCAVEQRDACPGGIFGAIDLSVDVTATLSARIVDIPPTDHGLELNLSLTNDASDWDVFRCWLGTGGIGALFFGATLTPILGVIIGIAGMVTLGELVRGGIHKKLDDTEVPAEFTKISADNGRVTYRRLESLKVLKQLINMDWRVDQDGLQISGNVLIPTADHTPKFFPPPFPLEGKWSGGQLNCATGQWESDSRYTLPTIEVSDQASAFGEKLWDVPVTIFNTTGARPGETWALMKFSALERPPHPQVIVSSRGTVGAGTTGRIYVHTSSGLVGYEISPVPAIPAAEPGRVLLERIRCAKQSVRANRDLGEPGKSQLGSSLVTLAGLLAEAGRHTEAIMTVNEAVIVYQELATAHPEDVEFAYRRAWVLIVLAQRLEAAGRRPEAAVPAGQAIDLLFTLVPAIEGTREDLVFDLIAQIGTNSGYLTAAEAVAPLQNLLPIAERLAGRHPEDITYAYRRAWALIVLAQRLDAAGRHPETAAPAKQAIDLLLGLVPSIERVREDLVFDLIAQVGTSSGYLTAAEAVAPVQDVVPVTERLAERHPEDVAYAYRRAWVLIVLAQRLEAAGLRPEAAAPAKQAIDLLFTLVPAIEDTREDLVFDLIAQIGTTSGYLTAAEAVAPLQNLLPIAERLAGRHPEDITYAFRRAWTLIVLAQRLDAAGRHPEAVTPAAQAIDLLFALEPTLEGVRDDLTFDLIAQVGINSGYLAPAEAVATVERLIPVAERLAQRHPEDVAYAYRRAWALIVLAQRLDAAGRRPEVATPAAQAISLLLELVPSIEGVRDDLVFDLIAQIGINSGYLAPADAVAAVEKAVEIAGRLAERHAGDASYADRLTWIREVLQQHQATMA